MEQQRRAREEEEAERALLSPGSDDEEANSAPTASLEPLVTASRSRWTMENGMLVEVGDPVPSCDVAFDRPRIATAQIPQIAVDCHALPPDEDPPRPVSPLDVNPPRLSARDDDDNSDSDADERGVEIRPAEIPMFRSAPERIIQWTVDAPHPHRSRGARRRARRRNPNRQLQLDDYVPSWASDASEDEPGPPCQHLRPYEPRPDRHAPAALEERGGGAEQQQQQHESRPQPGGAQVRLGGGDNLRWA